MREFRPYGSVRGALSNGRPYRDLTNWMDSEKIGASPFVFVMGKEQSPNRAKFIAAKSIKCA